MALKLNVNTICIPCDGSKPHMANFCLASTRDVGLGDYIRKDYNDRERWLRFVPQVWLCDYDKRTFSWKHRSLTRIFAKDLGDYKGHWRADYWIYTCRDEDAGLPRNKYLNKLCNTTVYGDAYLFRLITQDQNEDGSGTAMYHDLGRDFIDAVDKEELPKEILKKLMAVQ